MKRTADFKKILGTDIASDSVRKDRLFYIIIAAALIFIFAVSWGVASLLNGASVFAAGEEGILVTATDSFNGVTPTDAFKYVLEDKGVAGSATDITSANGVITFTLPKKAAPGVYKYILRACPPEKPYVDTDTTTYTFTVTVADDSTAAITDVTSTDAAFSYPGEEISFSHEFVNVERSITVYKKWNDSDNNDKIRPASVSVDLLADGEKVKTLTIPATSNSVTEDGLDTYVISEADVTECVYTVKESAVNGYTAAYSASGTDLVITNTHVVSTCDLNVKKVWVDDNDADGIRPKTIKVQLYADNEKKDAPVTVAYTADWKYTWKNLPVYADGEKIKYSVEELSVDGYTAATPVYDSATNTYTLTNTHVSHSTSCTVKKTWDDNDNQDGLRSSTVTVQLFSDGTPYGAPVKLNAARNWTYTWEHLPIYTSDSDAQKILYTVVETDCPMGYSPTYEDGGFNIVNKHNPITTTIKGNVVWSDDGFADKRPDKVIAYLTANGKTVGGSATLNAANSWSDSWINMPVYENGKKIDYSLKITTPDGYVQDIFKNTDGTSISASMTYSPPASNNGSNGGNGGGSSGPKTGDESRIWQPIALIIFILSAATVATISVLYIRKRKKAQ